jgi:nucleotide-binding universal stress UspA family protein
MQFRAKGKPLKTFQHILVPTDFSEPAEQAMEMAIDMAHIYHPKLTLVYATPSPSVTYPGYASEA